MRRREFFAGLGMLERRQKNRQETSITVVARWQLDQTELPARILNISDGGICLLLSQMKKVGDRIRLTLPDGDQDPADVIVTVCWQIHTDNGYVTGCEDFARASYLILKRVADRQAAEVEAQKRRRVSNLARR